MKRWGFGQGQLWECNRKVGVSLIRSVCTDFSWPPLPVPSDKNVFRPPWTARHLSQGSFISCFRKEREGQVALLAPIVFQVPLIQNNQYA